MQNATYIGCSSLRLLWVSSSVVALLIGGGAPLAFAGTCAINDSLNSAGPGPFSNSAAINCIAIEFSQVTGGGVTNAAGGTITATGGAVPTANGITIEDSSINGSISNAGTISAHGSGIVVYIDASVSGGISNSGTISADFSGIHIVEVSNFSSGIANSGTISSAFESGINVNAATFAGGISNGGTISVATGDGIKVGLVTGSTTVFPVSTFSGGISNSGTISAARTGVLVSTVSNFSGGISNSAGGTISAPNLGIAVGAVSTFTDGISNAGTLSVGGGIGIAVGYKTGGTTYGVTGFTGNVANAGTITAKTGISIVDSTLTGAVTDSGTINASSHGIAIDGASKIVASHTAISITGPTLIGGVSNAGTITGGQFSIVVGGIDFFGPTVTTFQGGLTNAGKISARSTDIFISGVSQYSGGISNSGTLTGNFSGIVVGGPGGVAGSGVTTFSGGINNTGAIAAGRYGILVQADPTFLDGITNSGTIAAATYGIVVGGNEFYSLVTSFAGGISNAGTVTAGDAAIMISQVGAFSGSISNSAAIIAGTGIEIGGGVTFAAGSAIVNSGMISGSRAAIDASLASSPVTIDQTGGLISGAIKLSANADQLNISGGSIAGNVVGAGSSDTINFNMGAGTFTYGAAYGFTGINQVNINSGTVILDGTNSATNIDVLGGTLAGTGTLDPLLVTIHSGGAFAPGTPGAPGTSMSITGNLAFQSGALYVIYLNPGTASFANVSGTASLNGTVNANFAAGSYIAKQYVILQSGGLNGTFSGLTTTNLPVGFDASLDYTSDDVLLDLSAGLGVGIALNENQQNVANALNSYFDRVGVLPPNFVPIFGLTDGALASALTRLDGEDATGAERGAFDLMNEFLGLMLDPFVDGRAGFSSGGQPLGFAPDQQASLPPDVALAYAGVLKALPPETFAERWRTWAAGFGGSATADGDPTVGSNNVTTSTYGYAAGMDYHYSPDTVFGFSLAGGGTNWNLANALGSGRSDAFLAGVYGVTHNGPWYLGGALAFANNWFATNRTAMDGQFTASFQGQSYAERLEGGYRFAVPVSSLFPSPASGGLVGITPYAAIQAQDFHTPAYSETDLTGSGFGLSYNAMNGTETRSELGSRFDDLTALGAMPLVLRAKVAWAHDWVSNPVLNASFESLPGTSFTVNGAPIPHDSALTSAGAQLFFTPNWSFLAKFDGEFASGSQLYAGSGTLRYTW